MIPKFLDLIENFNILWFLEYEYEYVAFCGECDPNSTLESLTRFDFCDKDAVIEKDELLGNYYNIE